MVKNINLKLTESNFNFLENLNNKTKIPVTKLINIMISDVDEKPVELLKDFENSEQTNIRFKITRTEKEFIEKEAKKSGAEKVTTEIKFRLLNSIYKNKFFTSNELTEFTKTRYELNMIGRNLNQLLKQIYTKEELKIDPKEIKEMIAKIDIKLEQLSGDLNKIIKHTKNRF